MLLGSADSVRRRRLGLETKYDRMRGIALAGAGSG
jgi:hypothetical protein